METTFAADFYEFGKSGRVWRRNELLEFSGIIDAVLPLPDLDVVLLSSVTALVTYTCVTKRNGDFEYARRSSIWSWQQDSWKLRFHQGTPFEPEAPKVG